MTIPTINGLNWAQATMSGLQETQRMIRPERRRALSLAIITALALAVVAPVAAMPEIEWHYQAQTPIAAPAGPPAPGFPVALTVDDGMVDGAFGVGGATARPFLWFTQFALPGGAQNLSLQEIWVLFAPDPNMMAGDAIQLVVYQDDDGDPTNGADLLATLDTTIQVVDGSTFSVYPIAPLEIVGGGEVLIGVVSRFVESGVTPFPTLPAAIDTSNSDGSAWFATWTGDPPNPPELPSDLVMQPLNASFPGVWMIRGFGRPIPDFQVIPTAGTWGLMILALAIAFGALRVLRGGAVFVVSVLALGTLMLSAPAAHATVVDDFSVAQATVTGTLGAPDASSVAAGLGGERDVEAVVDVGAGTTTATGTGSVMEIAVSDTTPDTRGAVVLVWDGVDGDPAIDPVGLGGVDLTLDAGAVQTGLTLDVTTTDTGTEATIEIFTDAGNASRIDFVLLASQTDYVLGYDDFVASLGAGADFSNVGAVVLTLAGTEKSVSVDHLATTGPVVVGLLADTLVPAGDADMDGNADPGDTLRYTATISNTGTEADQVDVNEMLSDLALVGGSVRTTPVARNDRYDDEACGNVTLTVAAAQGVLANDFDIDTNPLGVDVAMSDAMSIQGGMVTLAADGGFVYEPPPGFGGVDSFGYQLTLAAGDPTPPAPIRGTVTVLIDERVWFVDNDHPGTNAGTLANPFQTLAAVEAVAAAGDTIFIFEAANTTGLDTGLVLEDDQTLIGHGVDLVACGQTLVTASTRPTITHAAGIGVTLGTDNEIRGLNIGATNTRGISGNDFGTATLDEIDLTDAGAEALHLTNGTLAATIGTLSSASSGTGGVLLDNVGGTLTATSTTVTDPTGAGITIQNLPAGTAHDLGATMVTMAGSGGTPGHGVRVASNHSMATVTFGSLSITTENGPGFEAPMGGIVDIESTGASVMANGGPAVNINATTGRTSGADGWTFATLSSVGSPASGVVLTTLPVNFTVGTSTTVTDATGTGILPTGNAGRTIVFGATNVMDTNVGAGATGNGVDLRTGNAGATFNFASLSVIADGGFGVAANTSGTVNVTGGGTGVAATGGPALDASATALGMNVAGLSSANSPTTGVNLVNVSGTLNAPGGAIMGASGVAFNIGTGAANSGGNGTISYGGSITNTADRAVSIQRRTGGTVTLSGAVDDTGGTGIVLDQNNTGNPTVAFTGTGASGVDLTNTTGTAVTVSNSAGGTAHFADLDIDNGTSNQRGLFATANGGTGRLNVDTGTIDAGSATAVDLDNTVLGNSSEGGPGTSGGLTLTRASSIGGGAIGIDIRNTTGGFTIAGDGATGTGTSANNGTGGTIRTKTVDGVFLQNATNVALNYMNLGQAGGLGDLDVNGVRADNVNGFTLTRTNLRNIADQNSPDEAALHATEPRGTWVVANNLFDRSFDDHFRVVNTGTAGTMNVRDNTFRDNHVSTMGNDSVTYIGNAGGSNIAWDIKGNDFINSAGDAVQIALNGAASANVTIGGPTVATDRNRLNVNAAGVLGGGITFSCGGLMGNFSGTLTYSIQNNDIQGVNAQAINVDLCGAAADGDRYTGAIADNELGTLGTADSAGFGIEVQTNGAGTSTLTISGNVIREYDGDHGISLEARDGAGRINATITGNDVKVPSGAAFDALGIAAGLANGDTSVVCADVRNNTVNVDPEPGGFFADIFFFAQFGGTIILPGYGGGPMDAAAAGAFLAGNQTDAPSASGFVIAPAQVSGAGTTCP